MVDILTDLNEEQKSAVMHEGGPLLVLAGAGSGKTRTLTYRAAWLMLHDKVMIDEIVLLTFTNKAAEEMLSRVRELIGMGGSFGGTFHSYCARLLRRHGGLVGLDNNFVIYDQDDQEAIVKVIVDHLKLDSKKYKPRTILSKISEAKNDLMRVDDYVSSMRKSYWYDAVSAVYPEYSRILKESNAVDFDDLLLLAVELLRKNDDIRTLYQSKIKHVLVDEYQDTNKAQYVLTKLLSGGSRNLMAVGDFSQSIYSWRGADFRNLNYLKRDYPDLTVVSLEQNYRSTKLILESANSVIRKNNGHPILNLWTSKDKGERVGLFSARNELEEVAFVVGKIKEGVQSGNFNYRDFAVLYRTNAQSRVLEEAMLHAGVPYVLVGGTRFYQRREIKDVLSYLRLVVNENDSVSMDRVLKIGKRRWQDFSKWLDELDKNEKLTTLEIMDAALDAARYLERYNPDDEEDLARLDNIKELRSVAERFKDINVFLENVALVEQETIRDLNQQVDNKVTLMTLHAAKGLEFPVVFMIGMEEGLFPHSRSMLDMSAMEEERRLCYVGMTRAMKELYMTFAGKRIYFGRTSSFAVSRFISEIPESCLRLVGNDGVTMGNDIPF